MATSTPQENSILSQIFSGLKKVPGGFVGAPTDLVNAALNVAKDSLGFSSSKIDNPIGGSQWINKQFGMGDSKGLIDDVTQMVGGFISPTGAMLGAGKAALALKSIILPAALVHDATTLTAAQKLITAGRADKVYDITGIFPDTNKLGEPILKTVVPDTNVSLQPVGGVLRMHTKEGNATTRLPSDFSGPMSDVIDHPDLFNLDPTLAAIPVSRGSPMSGSFYPTTGNIKVGDINMYAGGNLEAAKAMADDTFASVALHETQHAVQQSYNFVGGSSPGYFIRDPLSFSKATMAARQDLSPTGAYNLKLLDDANAQTNEHYMNTAGEVEARIVQQQFTTGDYSVSPARTKELMEAGGDKIIQQPHAVPKIDDDPAIKSIIDYYNNPGTPQSGA